jgi:mRNA-degrading endonuclease RelE of RelBE toxin-antitoxin system
LSKTPDSPGSRELLQAPRFKKSKRRFLPDAQLKIDAAVKSILDDPLMGEPKTGGLRGVRVVKFKVGPLKLLLAYQFQERANRVELLDVGPHENFYRDLHRYLKGN